MKTLRSTLAILILMLSLNMIIFAQDETAEPKPTDSPAEATVVAEVPAAEPVTEETIDEHNALDDILEFLGALDVATIGLVIALVTLVLRIRTPQTSAEKQLNDEELARKELEARQTATHLDDLLVTLSRLANDLRPIADSMTATSGAQHANISGATDAVITTTTKTTINTDDIEFRG